MAKIKTLLEKINTLLWYNELPNLKDILRSLHGLYTSSINFIVAGTNITLTGTGTETDPLIINASGGGGSTVSTSELVNDGADGVNPFVTALDIGLQEATDVNAETTNPITVTIGNGQAILLSGIVIAINANGAYALLDGNTGTLQLSNTNNHQATIATTNITGLVNLELPNAFTGVLGVSVNGIPFDVNGNANVVDVASNFANDAAAAIGNIGVGKLYHTAGVVKIRLT